MAGKTSDWRPGPTVCRCCLTEGCYKDISTEYFWMGKREVYAEMLSDTFNVSISYAQTGGRLICEPCIARLRDASDFKRQVQDCEKTFMIHLDPSTSKSGSVHIEVESVDDVKMERVKVEKDESDDDDFPGPDFGDDDDDDDLDDEPLQKYATAKVKVPKKEAVEILDMLDTSQITVKRKSSSKTKEPPKKIKKKEVVVKPTTSKAKAAAAAAEKKKKGQNKDDMKWSLVRRHYDHRDNAAIIVDCSNVTPFRWKTGFFYCASCELASAEFDVIKQHTLNNQHQTESRSIFNKQIYLKVEVTGLKCELCSESIEDIEKLFEHLIEQHNKPLIKDYGIGVLPFVISGSEYSCIKCDETFKFFSHLNKHANVHYPNTVCPLCGKSFVYRHRMQTHMKTHEVDGMGSEQLKCPKCDLTFTTRYERAKHVAKHNIYKNRCQYCNESFKSHPAKLKHLREFHDKKINYPCTYCPAVFGACNFRTKHIAQVHKVEKSYSCELCPFASVTSSQLRAHMIKHSGEKKHQCQVCKKAYARRYTLREHMRIHENDRRFACMYCNSAFVQKCSLKSHMKTHHPHEPMEPLLDLKPFEKLEDHLPPPTL